VATNAEIYGLCCDVLLGAECEWIRRRKETAELVTESLLRHRMSLDFVVDDLPTSKRNDTQIAWLPMTLLRKEPGSFTRFDLVDESGRSLPLPNRDRNASVSAGVLAEAARRVLGGISPELRAELALIARTNKDNALAMVTGAYRNPEGPVARDADAARRRQLWSHDRFRWLLETLARSSVLVVAVPLDERPRRILKLSYEELIDDVTTLRKRPMRAKLAALTYRFGWRGYLLHVHSPFIGASSYHFELHAPDGMQLLAAGLNDGRRGRRDRRRVHLYVDDARTRQSAVAWAQFRIRGPGFVGAAAVTSLSILLALAGVIWQAPQLVDTATSGPALLLLFPGLVGGYLARPTHPLVTRLLNLARWTLVVCTGTAYVAAARLAIVSEAHPAESDSLRWFFGIAAAIAGICTAALMASWRLPRAIGERRTPPVKPAPS